MNSAATKSRSASGKDGIENLTAEILLMVTSYLSPIDAALFTLTSVTIYSRLGSEFLHEINDCSGTFDQSPFRSEFLRRLALDLSTHYLCHFCDKLHPYSPHLATETFHNRLITPPRTENNESFSDYTGDLYSFHRQLIAVDKNEDKNASIYHCNRVIRNSYSQFATTVGLVFGSTYEYDVLTHTVPFTLVEHLGKCRRLGKSTPAPEVFPASSSIYYGRGEDDVWTKYHIRAMTRLALDSTAEWGSEGLFVCCTLVFAPAQDTAHLQYNTIMPAGYGMIICPHVTTTRSSVLIITDKEYTRLYSNHEMCAHLREDLFTACDFTTSKFSSQVGSDNLYESEIRSCSTCPTEFQTCVDWQGKLGITIWRFIEDNVEDALRSNLGIPFNNLSEFTPKRKTKFAAGKIKESFESGSENSARTQERH